MNNDARKAQSEQEFLLLVSSNADPYWRDIPEIMARENGAGFHFRYRDEWVPKGIFANPSQLQNRVAYIVHLDGPKPEFEYIPIRRATVTEASNFGEHLRIEFRVDGFVEYPEHALRNGSRNPYADRILEAIKAADGRTGFNGDFLILCRMEPLPISANRGNWTRIVRELVRFPTFRDGTVAASAKVADGSSDKFDQHPTIFLYGWWHSKGEFSLDSITGHAIDSDDRRPEVYDQFGRLVVRGGQTYFLRVLQYLPSTDILGTKTAPDSSKFPVKLDIESDENILNPVIATTMVRGKYDDSYVSIRCDPLVSASETFIQLRSDSSYFNLPTLRFHRVVVKASRRLPAFGTLIVLLFVASAFVPPVLTAMFQGAAAVLLVILRTWVR